MSSKLCEVTGLGYTGASNSLVHGLQASYGTALQVLTAFSMSRFRTTGKISKSEPFAGLSIGRQIKTSAYGRFVDSLKQIESIIPAEDFSLKLPRVIVVGERSVGKSSLLENFTKCPMFPRGKGTCTKMPVRLEIKAVTSLPKYVATVRYRDQPEVRLTSTDGVLPAVQSFMDRAQGITADEITVEISQVILDLLAHAKSTIR